MSFLQIVSVVLLPMMLLRSPKGSRASGGHHHHTDDRVGLRQADNAPWWADSGVACGHARPRLDERSWF